MAQANQTNSNQIHANSIDWPIQLDMAMFEYSYHFPDYNDRMRVIANDTKATMRYLNQLDELPSASRARG